ncbi:oligosaccharide flippase family protein [Flavihumibacter sp. ZG627]|uniref:oligosaccharide flippase family protein n=1 Tax=Flavihumibacter sp. ZG627 TaxID=1463156 RepID=UPI0005806F9F|nr:oligosaccharide flippase family protein [Flavihumibacter sp. ZG627]KIC90174.1 hypothetical protein HY58_12500 [Flavihumibacter sp. ZG627]
MQNIENISSAGLRGVLGKLFKNKVFKNFSVLSASNVLVQALTIFSSIKIARSLGPGDFGKYGYFITLSGIYSVFAGFGLRTIITRYVSARNYNGIKLVRNVMLIRALLLIPISVIIFVLNAISTELVFDELLLFILIGYIFSLLAWDALEAYVFGQQKMSFSSVVNLSSAVLWVLIVLLIPKTHITVTLLLVITFLLALLKSAFLFFRLRNNSMLSAAAVNEEISFMELLKEAFPFFLLAVFTVFSTRVPYTFLAMNSTKEEVGFLNIALRIASPLQMLVLTMMSAVFPNINKKYNEDRSSFIGGVSSLLVLVVGVGMVGAFVISIFSNEIALLIYGKQYLPSADVIASQVWYTLLYAILCYIGTIFSVLHEQNLMARLSFVNAILCSVVLYIFSFQGAVGLSNGFIVASVIGIIFHWYYLHLKMPVKISINLVSMLGIIMALLYVVSILFADSGLIIRLLVAGAASGIIGVVLYNYFVRNRLKFR